MEFINTVTADGVVTSINKYYNYDMIFSEKYNGITLKSIANAACAGSIVRKIDMYNTKITLIEESAFTGCLNLVDLILPETITYIEVNAFRNVPITNFTVKPKLVDFFGAFALCSKITSFKNEGNPNFFVDDDGVFSSDKKTLVRARSNIRYDELNCIDTLEHIGMHAFSGTTLDKFKATNKMMSFGEGMAECCNNLYEVDLILSPAESIDSYCFKDCTNMILYSLPPKVVSLGIQAFSKCAIDRIYLPTTVSEIRDECFSYISKKLAIYYFGRKNINGINLFKGCSVTPTIYVSMRYKYDTFASIKVHKARLNEMFVPYNCYKTVIQKKETRYKLCFF
jgi:hypothetical protein